MKLLNGALVVAVAAVIGGLSITGLQSQNSHEVLAANHWGGPIDAKSYILQGANASLLNDVVANVGADVSREFPIINAVSAMLTPQQANTIRELGGIRIHDDRAVTTTSLLGEVTSLLGGVKSDRINNHISQQTGANILHDQGIKGEGVTVAIIDSGANIGGDVGSYLLKNSKGKKRVPVKYDAFEGDKIKEGNDDFNGHGTHISGIISSSLQDDEGNYNGIAPDAYLLSVKAFDSNGESSYSTVLDALNWVYKKHKKYKIRVVNMSLGADVRSHYWDDPINQAVMRLWEADIVVVTSAGNNGADMGITVPGNNPYVITVGAVTDAYTPNDPTDDRVTTFSSKGPTIEGFIKPDVVAYGARIASKMDPRFFAHQPRQSDTGNYYSEVSGTSQSSAVVAGIAALIIGNDKKISADDVKCRIVNSARVANRGQKLTYSPFQQGNGLVNAYAAVTSTASGCANQSLNIEEDLEGVNHFAGPARKDALGKFYIQLGDGSVLTEGNHWGQEIMNLEGNHWGQEIMNLEGNHWGQEIMNLEGNHWGQEIMNLEGNHWGQEIMNLEGNHWGLEIMNLEGNHWGLGIMNLESLDLNQEPIDSNVEVPFEVEVWL